MPPGTGRSSSQVLLCIEGRHPPMTAITLLEGLPNLIKLPSSMPSRTPKMVAVNNGSCVTILFSLVLKDCWGGGC